uniref:Uncharacterized protein n=1 Tax=Amphimedon queenslandica TaxID=400682 RepID=A0A1X7TPX6_AMPQE
MDGKSLCTLFESSLGPDCLKDVVPKLELRLHLYKEIKEKYSCNSSVVEETTRKALDVLSQLKKPNDNHQAILTKLCLK